MDGKKDGEERESREVLDATARLLRLDKSGCWDARRDSGCKQGASARPPAGTGDGDHLSLKRQASIARSASAPDPHRMWMENESGPLASALGWRPGPPGPLPPGPGHD